MAQPIVKYTLTKQGRIPEWLSSDSRAFAGEHSISGNKDGYIPRYESPQNRIMLGIAAGDPDPDGTPDDYIGTFANKTALQTYLVTVGNALKYKTTTNTVTGVQTSVTTGLSTAWDANPYAGGLSTTTSTKYTASGVGTVATISTSQVTKVVVNIDTTTGDSSTTTNTPVVIDPASTLSGVSTSVGIVTTSSTEPGSGLAVTTTTTTDTTSYTYTDVVTGSVTSKSETTTDGVTTRTDTVVTSSATNYETTYDYAAEATRLWDIYTAINS